MTLVNELGDGFHMPAEWEKHDRCWMAWPRRNGFNCKATKKNYATVAKAISEFETVSMVTHPDDVDEAKQMLGNHAEIVEIPIDDAWARDSGPNFLIDDKGNIAGSCFSFNCWGENYFPYDQDAKMAERIMKHEGFQYIQSSLKAEGGGITVDGEGTVITTESCFLNPNRNPGWTKKEVEDELRYCLGVEKVIWIPGNVDEDETNGHVDGIAAFVRPSIVLMEKAFSSEHPFYHVLNENIRAMKGQTDARGREIDITFIEDAWGAKEKGDRFCLSYINAYLANGAVIMPKYNLPTDERARKVYEKLYPSRKIVQIQIDDIAQGGGGIHCITQQQPSAK
ncbi:agmatine deiminase family protein [Curvivirga sp.]|uniref:agmatine deiminase family protein n=1 Tax=Curvivirga sp. TaxID=2856848 RepID=UPI003B5AD3D2